MLVSEWSLRGHVVWCDATDFVRAQLSSELRDATFTDSAALPMLLLQLVMATQTTNSSDTRL